jgi:hypothetical protein
MILAAIIGAAIAVIVWLGLGLLCSGASLAPKPSHHLCEQCRRNPADCGGCDPRLSNLLNPVGKAGNLGGNATCLTRSVRGVSTGFSSTRHGEPTTSRRSQDHA